MADQRIIDAAAAWLRSCAWQESYAGFADKDRAFMFAGLLNTLSLQLDQVPPAVRAEVVRTCGWMMGRRDLRSS